MYHDFCDKFITLIMRQICFWVISVQHGLCGKLITWFMRQIRFSGSLVFSMVCEANSQHGFWDKHISGSLVFSLIVMAESIKYKNGPFSKIYTCADKKDQIRKTLKKNGSIWNVALDHYIQIYIIIYIMPIIFFRLEENRGYGVANRNFKSPNLKF